MDCVKFGSSNIIVVVIFSFIASCVGASSRRVNEDRECIIQKILECPCQLIQERPETESNPRHVPQTSDHLQSLRAQLRLAAAETSIKAYSILTTMVSSRVINATRYVWPYTDQLTTVDTRPFDIYSSYRSLKINLGRYAVHLSQLLHREQHWSGTLHAQTPRQRHPTFDRELQTLLHDHLAEMMCILDINMDVVGIKLLADEWTAVKELDRRADETVLKTIDWADALAYSLLNTFIEDYLRFCIKFTS